MTRSVCVPKGWTDAEVDLVRREYGRVPTDGLCRRMGGRHSVNAIRHLAKKLKLRHACRWTAGQDEILRQGWGKVRTSVLAQKIGRSPNALKLRAIALGLDAGRYYTDQERQLIRDLYATHTAAEIAERLHGTGRAALAINRMAQKLGLRKEGRHSAEVLDLVRRLHQEGKTWRQIADASGLSFDQVKHIGKRLKLPTHPDRERGRRSVASQLKTLGLSKVTELRTRAYRNYARECGWPEDLRPREVQILNVLAEHGPKTGLELAAAIGARTDLVNRWNGGHPKCLHGNGPGGTYTATLRRRGLVYYVHRAASGKGKGARLPGLYLLTPAAIAIRETLLKENPCAKVSPSPKPAN